MKQILEKEFPRVSKISKIPGEASKRQFFRLHFPKYTWVAMVFPEKNKEEIAKVFRFTQIYLDHHVPVPQIKQIINDQIIILEDLGDLSGQKKWRQDNNTDREKWLEDIFQLLKKIGSIPSHLTDKILNKNRMKWELDFFLTHFWEPSHPSSSFKVNLSQALNKLTDQINETYVFSHRDFHSRNMIFYKKKTHLVDFQDSLMAPEYYDLVSFAYDAYLDLGKSQSRLWAAMNHRHPINWDQLYLTALQRNIKALGTFGYQINQRGNRTYKRYIPRTIGYVLNNPLYSNYFGQNIFD